MGVYVCVPSGLEGSSFLAFGEGSYVQCSAVLCCVEEFCGRCVWESPVTAITDSRQHKSWLCICYIAAL